VQELEEDGMQREEAISRVIQITQDMHSVLGRWHGNADNLPRYLATFGAMSATGSLLTSARQANHQPHVEFQSLHTELKTTPVQRSCAL
jgi:hypothetical protein